MVYAVTLAISLASPRRTPGLAGGTSHPLPRYAPNPPMNTAMSDDRPVKTTNEFPPRRENGVYIRESGSLPRAEFFRRVILRCLKKNWFRQY